VDWRMAPAEARTRLRDQPVACQGNLDPAWLHAPPAEIRRRTREMVSGFGTVGYIANLGHGILRDTPVEHVAAFVDAVRAGSATGGGGGGA
jgi:uroporphyrinogen decarboxylase